MEIDKKINSKHLEEIVKKALNCEYRGTLAMGDYSFCKKNGNCYLQATSIAGKICCVKNNGELPKNY